MAYATPEDMRLRFTERILAHVTDPDGLTVQEPALVAALADASGVADAFLSRFSLPLAETPRVLTLHVCNIALYQLLNLRPYGDLEDARKRYVDALKFLEDVARGRTDLGLTPSGGAPEDSSGALASGQERVFTASSLAGY